MAPLPEIRPCPFCGHSASIEVVPQGSTVDPRAVRFTVGCDNPAVEDCMGYQSLSDFDRRSEAIEAWNRRAVPTAQIAALKWAANAIMQQDAGDPESETGWASDEALAHWQTIQCMVEQHG